MTKTPDRRRKREEPAPQWWQKLTRSLSGGMKTREDLLRILQGARDQKLVDADALVMIEGVLGTMMSVVEQEWPLDKVLPVVVESGHSRFPVVSENSKDKVVGILLAKDLLRYTSAVPGADPMSFDLARLLRPAVLA